MSEEGQGVEVLMEALAMELRATTEAIRRQRDQADPFQALLWTTLAGLVLAFIIGGILMHTRVSVLETQQQFYTHDLQEVEAEVRIHHPNN